MVTMQLTDHRKRNRSSTNAAMSYKLLISSIAEVHARTQADAAGAVNRHLTLSKLSEGGSSPFAAETGTIPAPTAPTEISSPAVTKSNTALPTPLDGRTLLRLSWSHLIELGDDGRASHHFGVLVGIFSAAGVRPEFRRGTPVLRRSFLLPRV